MRLPPQEARKRRVDIQLVVGLPPEEQYRAYSNKKHTKCRVNTRGGEAAKYTDGGGAEGGIADGGRVESPRPSRLESRSKSAIPNDCIPSSGKLLWLLRASELCWLSGAATVLGSVGGAAKEDIRPNTSGAAPTPPPPPAAAIAGIRRSGVAVVAAVAAAVAPTAKLRIHRGLRCQLGRLAVAVG